MRTFATLPASEARKKCSAHSTSLTRCVLPSAWARSASAIPSAPRPAAASGASAAPMSAACSATVRARFSSSLAFGSADAATTRSYAASSSGRAAAKRSRKTSAAAAIASASGRTEAYRSFPAVIRATMAHRAAPSAPTNVAALPPPGVGPADASRSRYASIPLTRRSTRQELPTPRGERIPVVRSSSFQQARSPSLTNQRKSNRIVQTIEKTRGDVKDARLAGACLHVTTETANLMLALKAGGAEIALCASNPLSTQDDVAAALCTHYEIPTYAIKGEDEGTYYSHIESVIASKPHMSMDDGCDLVTTIYTKHNALLKEMIGGCEETTTGVIRLHAME